MPPTPLPSAGFPSRAGARQWWGLALLTLPLIVLSLDVSVLFLAAPALSVDLAPSATQLLWIMDVYAFLIAGSLVTMGTLGDRIGRRRLLMIGASAFAAASVLAAFAPTPELLIVARGLLGVAGATLMPSTLSLINTLFVDARQRALAIAIWMTTFSAGVALGPIVGGALLQWFWWGSVFLLAVPPMAVVVIVGPFLLSEARGGAGGRLDLPSVVLSLVAVLSIIWSLKVLAELGVSAIPVGVLAAGLVVGLLFVRRQRRIDHPLVDVDLFRDRRFTASLLILLLGITAINGISFLVPQYLQLVEGATPLRAGLLMIPLALASIAGSMLAPFVAGRLGPVWVITGGAGVSVVGLVLITQVSAVAGTTLLVAASVVTLIGLSPMGVLTTDMVLASAPNEKAGSAASLSETSGEFGVGLGVAAVGSIAGSVYTAELVQTAPSGLAADVAATSSASLVGAMESAASLPVEVGEELAAAAREAFTSGLNVSGAVGAVLVCGVAVVASALLRHVVPAQPQGDEVTTPETEPAHPCPPSAG